MNEGMNEMPTVPAEETNVVTAGATEEETAMPGEVVPEDGAEVDAEKDEDAA